MHLQSRHLAPGTINLRLGAVRRLAYEAADCGLLSADLAAGIRRVKGVKRMGVRLGNWLTAEQGATLWQVPDRERLKGKRDRALLSSCLRVGSGVMKWPSWPLATSSNARDIGRSLISGRSRSDGADSRLVYRELSTWTEAAGIHSGRVFRRVSSPGKPWGDGVTEEACLARRQGIRHKNGSSEPRAPRPSPNMSSLMSGGRRRTGANSVSAWPCLRPNHRALPRLYAADRFGSEPQDRNRAGPMRPPTFGRVADNPDRASPLG